MTGINHFKKNHRNPGVAGNPLWLKAHHKMGTMELGKRFSFELERDYVCARHWNRLGRNDRLNLVLRIETGGQRLPIQHDAVEWPHSPLPSYSQHRGTGSLDEKERRYFEVQRQALIRIE